MKPISLIVAITLLAACTATSSVMSSYTGGERVIIQTPTAEKEIKGLDVWFHAAKPNKAAVWPHNYGSIVLWSFDDTRWVARYGEHSETYRDALFAALAQRNSGTCSIDHADPHPTGYMIEFSYTCKEE